MKSKRVKIGSIEIEINGEVIKLGLEEAKELKDILNDTFPEREITYVSYPPIYIERYREYPRWGWEYAPVPYCDWGNSAGVPIGDIGDCLIVDNVDTLRLSYSSEN